MVARTRMNVTLYVHFLLLNTKLGPFGCKGMCSTPLYHKIAHRYHHQQQQQKQQGFKMLPIHRADMIFKFFGTKLFAV